MILNVLIEDKRISDLLTGHMGSASDWLKTVAKDGNGYRVDYDRENDPEGSFQGSKKITPQAIQDGLQLMAGHPDGAYQWGQFLQENDDDLSFDVAWQFIIFGKVIYG